MFLAVSFHARDRCYILQCRPLNPFQCGVQIVIIGPFHDSWYPAYYKLFFNIHKFILCNMRMSDAQDPPNAMLKFQESCAIKQMLVLLLWMLDYATELHTKQNRHHRPR